MSDMASASKKPCTLLDRLPTELRLEIYGYVYADLRDIESDTAVELSSATPPFQALILTCRTFYNEANEQYRQAYRDYWPSHKFTIDVRKSLENFQIILENKNHGKVKEEDLANAKQIQVLSMTQQGSGYEFCRQRGEIAWRGTLRLADGRTSQWSLVVREHGKGKGYLEDSPGTDKRLMAQEKFKELPMMRQLDIIFEKVKRWHPTSE